MAASSESRCASVLFGWIMENSAEYFVSRQGRISHSIAMVVAENAAADAKTGSAGYHNDHPDHALIFGGAFL